MARSEHRLLSRKLWAGIVGSVSPILTQAITGAVGWPVAAGLSALAVASYLLAQGHEDGARAKRKAE
jgi:hypothetical protein